MKATEQAKKRRGRPKQANRLKRATLTLHPEDWAQFEELAAASGQSSAALIRLAMREFLDRRRDGKLLAVRLAPGKARREG